MTQSNNRLEYVAPGIKVSFTYAHHLNRKSFKLITKTGTVVRTVKHRNPFYSQQVAVLFEGNNRESIVQIDRLKICQQS